MEDASLLIFGRRCFEFLDKTFQSIVYILSFDDMV